MKMKTLILISSIFIAGICFAGSGQVIPHRFRVTGNQTVSDFPLTANQKVFVNSPAGNISSVDALVIQNAGGGDHVKIKKSGGSGIAELVIDNSGPCVACDASLTFQVASADKWSIGQDIGSTTDKHFAIVEGIQTLANSRLLIKPGGNVGIATTAPHSTLHVNGSLALKRTATSGNYTILSTDYYIGVTNTAAPRTISLPSAAGITGRVYVIKDESGGASLSTPITIIPSGSQTIDGSAAITINSTYGKLSLISDGNNWFTF